MERGTFAGGCFFAAATVEMDGRPGPVRDAVAAQMTSWAELLTDYLRTAIERGELVADADPEQLAFELDALGTAVNSGWQLHEDAAVFERGRRAIARLLEAHATEAGRAALAAAAPRSAHAVACRRDGPSPRTPDARERPRAARHARAAWSRASWSVRAQRAATSPTYLQPRRRRRAQQYSRPRGASARAGRG